MKNSLVQVYVASTQGLIQVQSITALTDPNLRSVVSLNSSSELAGISASYANFVSPPQGLIQAHFGGNAYRVNVSADINQGNSWQLGFYIAHFLQKKHLAINSGLGETTTIIVATGEINTLECSVNGIQHLAKKCARANTQIQNWLAQGKKVLFLVPADNYREPIPDSLIELTPISTLDQLPYLFAAIGLSNPQALTNEVRQTGHKKESQLNVSQPSYLEPDLPNAQTCAKNTSEANNAVVIDAIEKRIQWWHKLTKPSRLIALCIFLLISILVFVGLQANNSSPHIVLQGLDYRYAAIISENRASCRLAYEMAQAKEISQPYIGNPYIANINGGDANGISQFGNFVQLPTSRLNNICQLTLETSQAIKAVWLLYESKALIVVNPIVEPGNNRKWSIPIPQNRRQDSRYHLLIFTQDVDAADLQSLQSLLQKMHDNGQAQSLQELSQWSTRLSLSVLFVEHQLLIH